MAEKFSVTGEQYRNVSRRMREIQRQLDQDGGSPLDPRIVLTGLQCIVENRVRGDMAPHTIEVNYDLPLPEAISAGDYNMVGANLTTERFPPIRTRSGVENIEVHLVHTRRRMNTGKAMDEIDKLGLRPATIEELLAFGASQYTRDLQRQFRIIALGSFYPWLVTGQGIVPGLDGDDNKRDVFAFTTDRKWGKDDRFLAVWK